MPLIAQSAGRLAIKQSKGGYIGKCLQNSGKSVVLLKSVCGAHSKEANPEKGS